MTDLEQLFLSAAALAEEDHPPPGDPLGLLARTRAAHRRRRWTAIAVPVAAAAAAAAVLVPSVLSRGGDGGVATEGPPAPETFVALAGGHAGLYDARDGTRIRDFGPAVAVAPGPDGVWVGSGARCSSVLRFFAAGRSFLDAEMPVGGRITAVAISPSGGTVAYSVAHTSGPTDAGSLCGSPDLVLRDGPSGHEQRWRGGPDTGEISQLTWSADGEHLAFQTTACCDATTTLHVLGVHSAPTALINVPSPLADHQQCRFTLPAFMGNQLFAVRQCEATNELVRIGTTGDVTVVRRLPATDPVALSVAGRTILLALNGTAETPSKLLRLEPDGTELSLGTGFSQPTWTAPGSTQASPAATAETTTQASPAGSMTCTYQPRPEVAVGRQVGFPPSDPGRLPTEATIHTNRGDITIALADGATPCTVNSFAHLARTRYYEDTTCHRLTTQGIFMVQCGDPSGKGTGGPGYVFADEHLAGSTYPAGTVAMANAGPDTNGSQFFLVYGDANLGPDYTVFGHLTAGLDVLRAVAAGGAQPAGDGQPKLALKITSITLG
ncbi:MAG: putative peptidyl-prolyl cis-trans isomerase [Frankiales bacterium]|nr:putative peptidyl-prolyl cis-trans isomerase [Frankiales bacterium]